MKNIKWSSIAGSICYIAAGIYLWIYPGTSLSLIAQVISIGAIVLGVIRMLMYLILDVRTILFRNDFIEGIVLILFGAMAYYNLNEVVTFVPYVLSGIILTSGFARIQDGIDIKRTGYKHAALVAVLSIISIAVGLFTIYQLISEGKITVQAYSIGLIYAGASNLLSSIYLSTRIFKFYSDQRKAAEAADKKKREEEMEVEIERRVSVRVAEELEKAKQVTEEQPTVQEPVEQPVEKEEKKSFFSGLFKKEEPQPVVEPEVVHDEVVTEPVEVQQEVEEEAKPIMDEVVEVSAPDVPEEKEKLSDEPAITMPEQK